MAGVVGRAVNYLNILRDSQQQPEANQSKTPALENLKEK
jgi:hypothetical protein